MKVGQMRLEVLMRDGGCMAPKLDPEAGQCFDQWGYPFRPRAHPSMNDLEADYIRVGAKGKRHELPEDHVALCAGHHRGTGPNGGYIWATAHRPLLRDYLDRLARSGVD